jgi:hypothetical protein
MPTAVQMRQMQIGVALVAIGSTAQAPDAISGWHLTPWVPLFGALRYLGWHLTRWLASFSALRYPGLHLTLSRPALR